MVGPKEEAIAPWPPLKYATGHQPVNMASHFLWHFRRSSILNVSFFVLTKRWLPILLSKLSKNYAVSGQCINYIC